MSHFPVLVAVKDPAELAAKLAPFHEFECTGTNDQYVIAEDVTDEYANDFQECAKEGTTFAEYMLKDVQCKVAESEDALDIEGDHQFMYMLLNHQGGVEKIVRRTNPNAKWDWWVVGGRWKGRMPLKGSNNLRADEAQVKDIDFDLIVGEVKKGAEEAWDYIADKANGGTWRAWVDVSQKVGEGNEFETIEAARQFYHSQETLKLVRKDIDNPFFNVDFYVNTTREDYVQSAIDCAFSFHAMIDLDGQWHQKGEMGWFGMSNDEVSAEKWGKKLMDYVNSLDDDVWLICVDCHI